MKDSSQDIRRGLPRAFLKKSRVLWMRWRGWKCEGPFPGRRSRTLLIAGPGLDEGQPFGDLLESRLGFRARWWPPSKGVPSESPLFDPEGRAGILIVRHDAEHLDALLGQCAAEGIPFHLTTVARRVKRVRCNTPITPGAFTHRERAYIARIFSYGD